VFLIIFFVKLKKIGENLHWTFFFPEKTRTTKCNVKGDCLTIVQSDLILDFMHNCINRLVVTALHHGCMKMHGCLIF